MKYFVMINNLLMTTVEADSRKEAEEIIDSKLVKDVWVRMDTYNETEQRTKEFTETVKRCKVISMEELSLMFESWRNADIGDNLARDYVNAKEEEYIRVKRELKEAKEKAKETQEWFWKQADEVGMLRDIRMSRYYTDDEDDDEED